MAVTPDNLLTENGGEVYAPFFSAFDNLNAQLQTWIDAAPDGLEDATVEAFAYMRAFRWKALHTAESGGSVSVEGVGSKSNASDQGETWYDLRDYWQSRYDELKAEEEGEPDPTPPLRSQSVSSTTSWV